MFSLDLQISELVTLNFESSTLIKECTVINGNYKCILNIR
jgi:hypothetical protein